MPTKRSARVMSSTTPGGARTDVPFGDGMPDTVPLGSWLTVVVEGSNPDYASSGCADAVNRCIEFQMQYDSVNPNVALSTFNSPWLPNTPFDSNPTGTTDYQMKSSRSADHTATDHDHVEIFCHRAPSLSVSCNVG